MAFVDVIKSLLGKAGEELAAQPGFEFQADSQGLNFYLPKAAFIALQEGRGSTLQKVQLITLRMLEEQGLANPLPNGFMVLDADLAGLEAEQADLLLLPRRLPGSFVAQIIGRTGNSSFLVVLYLKITDCDVSFTR